MKYSVGARVRVRGLVTAAEHNGKNGGVVGVQGERYKVKIEGATSILAVKEVNLEGFSVEPLVFESFEEADDCAVCFNPMKNVKLDYRKLETSWFACCGQQVCFGCRTRLCKDVCPFCRQECSPSWEEEIERERQLAERGMAWGCFKMGYRYSHGVRVQKNYDAAFEFLLKAARKGYIPAWHRVANCYLYGVGVEKSEAMAFQWLKIAVEAGCPEAQCYLGVHHLDGIGVHRSHHYLDGPVGSDSPYLEEGVVERNAVEAVRLLRLSAEQGYTLAQTRLADCYFEGIGVEHSLKLAVKWGLKASVQTDCRPNAQFNLFFALTRLRVHDGYLPPAALYWIRKAAAQGHDEALTFLPPYERKIDRLPCAHCEGKSVVGKKTRRCARCHAVNYCSNKCQRSHWRVHKLFCCDKDTDTKDFVLNLNDYFP